LIVCFCSVGVYHAGKVKAGQTRRYDNVNSCYFCQKLVPGLVRHYLCWHSDEVRIKNITLLPKKSKERLAQWDLLQHEGNFKHNVQVLKTGVGSLIVARRELELNKLHRKFNQFLPCEFCFKFIICSALWEHVRTCRVKLCRSQDPLHNDQYDNCNKENNARVRSRCAATQNGRSLLYRAVHGDEIHLLPVLKCMNEGQLKDVIQTDKIIKRVMEKNIKLPAVDNPQSCRPSCIHRVSGYARILARLVVEVQKTIPNSNLDTILKPDNFKVVVESTMNLCTARENKTLTLGIKMECLLGQAISAKRDIAIESDIYQKQQDEANKFKKLLENE